jgi:hypothetical protein
MIEKYSIDLRQFNNGESGKITFPTFDQCVMYGMHKLKESLKKKTSIVQAILIEDTHRRKIVVSPCDEEVTSYKVTPVVKVKLEVDPHDGDMRLTL